MSTKEKYRKYDETLHGNVDFAKNITFKKGKLSAGFTLVEVVITVAIIVLITSVLFGNFGRFTTNAEFDNLATDIVLSIREAQVYGTSVREGTNEFNNAYGLHIDRLSSKYIIFADDGDSIYTNTGSDSILSETQLKTNFSIIDISTGAEDSLVSGQTVLDLVFLRPSPDAQIRSTPAGGPFEYATVTIQNPAGKQKVIEIGSTGQVTVNNL